ncbi:MAG: hypothetical protein HQM15_02325 [Deltaproteobacteria bacterium]|nr:hypothetical protein [Deltaproteobacteria bacterium]
MRGLAKNLLFLLLSSALFLAACGGELDSDHQNTTATESQSILGSSTGTQVQVVQSENYGGLTVSNAMGIQGKQTSEHYQQMDPFLELHKRKVNSVASVKATLPTNTLGSQKVD